MRRWPLIAIPRMKGELISRNRIRLAGGVSLWWVAGIAVVFMASPLLYGFSRVQGAALSSNLAVFGQFMGSPIQLVFPLLAAGLGCTTLFQELSARFVVNLRTRIAMTDYLRIRLIQSAAIPFFVVATSVLLVFAVCFIYWPAIGNPSIDISVFVWTPEERAASDGNMFGFSELIDLSPWAYGIWIAVWTGLCAAAYSAATAACLLVVERKAVAILIPGGIFLVETIVAALAGNPYAGLLYSAFPFSLQQQDAFTTAAPTLVLVSVIVLSWVRILRNPYRLRALL